MSQERWDVVVRFLNGPLQWQGDIVMRGPVVRIGSSPGPNGLKLDGYRALDDRHAVISAYQGGTVQIAPVGPNQVRMAPHENVDWGEIQPLRVPTFLSEGCAVHLGPPGRGATFTFVECRRLGVWTQQALLSEAAEADPSVGIEAKSQVQTLDIAKRIPLWFVPIVGLMVLMTCSGVGLIAVIALQRDVEQLGPSDPGQDYYDYGDVFAETTVNANLKANTGNGFVAFVSATNAELAGDPSLKAPEKADPQLLEWTTRAEQMYIRGWKFWGKLDRSRDTYAMVLTKLRAAKMPEVLAGIPYQESGYNPVAKDVMLCAMGLWQFQPEIAYRNGLRVEGCHMRGSSIPWKPTEKALPINAIRNAEYVADAKCQISSCDVDERTDAAKATDAALRNFLDGWNDPEFRASGAMVQMLVATHNAGYDDSKYRSNGAVSRTNVARAYKRYLKETGKTRAPDFIGQNIKCASKSDMDPLNAENINATCGSYLPNVTQTYVPYVIAQHLLAACYYGKNYGSNAAFADYRKLVAGDGYCQAIKVPSPEEVAAHASGG
ncbi:MAG: transglycosylase SLT domain-containing protein [Deltaproteobacteria bacterium]|nr:transglycosylase SLT domain-containing protein [Deltaproteobacteria bacterium]